MSVTTTSDEKIILAKEYINYAYKELLSAIDDNTWGHDEFNDEYLNKIEDAILQLLKLKRML
jgi:hypothetical protein